MQKEYMEAVRNKDKETQSKLKMRLNGLSTSVQSLKENLTLAAELKNSDLLSNGRTRDQKLISATCTDLLFSIIVITYIFIALSLTSILVFLYKNYVSHQVLVQVDNTSMRRLATCHTLVITLA